MNGYASGGVEELSAQLACCPDEKSRRRTVALEASLVRADVVDQLVEMVRKEVRVDTRRALRFAETATAIAAELGNPKTVASSLRAKANALWFSGEYRSSVELYARALRLFEDLHDDTETGRTLLASIQPLIFLGDYERALAAGERARAIFTALGDGIRLARLEINVGNIFFRRDRFEEALACYENARRKLEPDKDVEGLASALHNIAVSLISLDRFQEALAAYQEARSLCERHDMPLAVLQADYNVAYLYYLRGEYGRAIDLLRTTREACQRAGDAYHTALCHLDLSEIYLELNLGEEAAEMAREGFTQFRQLGMGYEAAKCLTNQAIAFGQQEKAFRALELFAEARTMFVQEKNQVWPSLIDLYQALVLLQQGRLHEAQRLGASALNFFRSSSLSTKTVICRLLLARVYLQRGDREGARREAGTALNEVEHLETPVVRYQAQFLMGLIEEASGNEPAAYAYYRSASKTLEALRGGLRGEELKIAFLKNRLEVYENLAGLCLKGCGQAKTSTEEAWGYMEEAKSRILRDLIFRGNHLTPVEPAQSELVRRIRDLREELNWYCHRIEAEELRQAERSPNRVEKLQGQRRECEQQFLRALRELPAAAAESAGLETAASITLEAVRETLPPHATLLEYFRIRDRFVVALLTRETLEVIPVTLVSRVSQLLTLVRFQLSKFRLGADYVRMYHDTLLKAIQRHLQELFQEIVAPIQQRLEGRHLVIVPHDVLHYVPFHALFDGTRYLIDMFTVSYAPSAAIYAMCEQKRANTAGPSLILAVPDPETPFILEEAQAVAGTVPDPLLLCGKSASREELQKRGPESRLVHIATHGFFRADNPMFSGIRLGDGYLSLYDLYGSRLPAELVAFSGCATGLNVLAAGDELLGLARGLLRAGAQSLLLSLWDVHDRSTAEFMTSFYTFLRCNGHKALALQAAMQDLRVRYPHPYFWAPFVLVGKAVPS